MVLIEFPPVERIKTTFLEIFLMMYNNMHSFKSKKKAITGIIINETPLLLIAADSSKGEQ